MTEQTLHEIPGISLLRRNFLENLKSGLLFEKKIENKNTIKQVGTGKTINIADISSSASILISNRWANKLPGKSASSNTPQTTGTLFESVTKEFIKSSFKALSRLRPGEWEHDKRSIVNFDQYYHLNELTAVLEKDKNLKSIFGGDYLITPDIVVFRSPLDPKKLGGRKKKCAEYTPLLKDSKGAGNPILHASISCKLTIRSDRAQNSRTEAVNLIRNRKGKTPHIVAVTAEPLPSRIASLALGTGDLDCTYHAALFELKEAVDEIDGFGDSKELLETMIAGRRLRDISDLPFDLII